MTDLIQRLEAALDAIERIAFEMPPPNSYTPRIVQITTEAKMAALKAREAGK